MQKQREDCLRQIMRKGDKNEFKKQIFLPHPFCSRDLPCRLRDIRHKNGEYHGKTEHKTHHDLIWVIGKEIDSRKIKRTEDQQQEIEISVDKAF